VNKTFIIITVDVEDFFLPRPETDMIFARIGNEYYGITRMMDIMDNHNVKGTFFVDVYNRETLSEAVIKEACQEIDRRGHEVALHVHPEIPRGKKGYRKVISKYELEEQIKIIERGRDLLGRWIGRSPRAHRAGGYGANYDTLRALGKCNLLIDSSMFYEHDMCGLNEPLLTINAPKAWNQVLEIPITVTLNQYILKFLRRKFKVFELYKKVDLGWSDLKELKVQIWELRKMGINPIIVFLHSYSFVDVRGNFGPDRRIENNFQELVHWMRTLESTDVLTMGKFYDIYNGGNFVSSNQVPILTLRVNDFELRDVFRTVRNLRCSHLRIIAQFLQRRLRCRNYTTWW
jgi:hypothetical protein